MESSKNYKRGYIKASSLIESVIAIAIITICLLVALKLYTTILNGRPSVNNHKLKFTVDKLVSEMKLNPKFDSEIYDYRTYKIRKTVTDYEDDQKLKRIEYTIENHSDTITYTYLMLENEQH